MASDTWLKVTVIPGGPDATPAQTTLVDPS